MNSLAERFGSDLAVIGFPTNQFGGETNEAEFEILNTLAHVRPGGGFKPRFTMMGKVEVNGKGAHPLFRLLLDALPTVSDDCGGRGADFIICPGSGRSPGRKRSARCCCAPCTLSSPRCSAS